MNILFVAGVAVITSDGRKTRDLLSKSFGLPLAGQTATDEYVFSERIEGSKHFGVWPLAQVALACFGTSTWPRERPTPQATIEFEVSDEEAVGAAEQELRAQGHELLHGARKEPWGQTVCRLLTSEGVILGISYAPWLHTKKR
ncbi:MAG TPA: VOC family protein [Polyangiaceae bacterium]|nr:VOC family protein [Polyangiaceae bacterium]